MTEVSRETETSPVKMRGTFQWKDVRFNKRRFDWNAEQENIL